MYILGGKEIRRDKRSAEAELYILLMLLSFVASAESARVWFVLTGYPQIGGGGLHIANMLWGGLLLFASALLMLTLANRWVLPLSAILTGIGVGLFIDEIGKFLTATNDIASQTAPMIYAFFLLTILLYFQTRRPAEDFRSQSYSALDHLTEVMDEFMNEAKRRELETYLQRLTENEQYPHQRKLAGTLLELLRAKAPDVNEQPIDKWDRWRIKFEALEAKWIDRGFVKAILVMGLVLIGLLAVSDLVTTTSVLIESRAASLRAVTIMGQMTNALVGVVLLASAGLLIFRREQAGLSIAYFCLLLAMLSVFYVDLHSVNAMIVPQFVLLLLVLRRRRRYAVPASVQPAQT